MLYRGITQVSVIGLDGTMYVEKAQEAEGVSVQATGPYEAKVAGESWLVICPEGYELASPARASTAITAEGTQVGSVDVTARLQFGLRAGSRRRGRGSARARASVRITAPPDTRFELIGCRGIRKGPGGWRFMEGTTRFTIR